ncbi:MAG TPA: hypothetical protein PLV96_00470 [Methanoregulaceae archaeon]|jgi:hypothetical protein|nr:hypothetical protein [Methanoregulaceae archaeon]HQN17559.1 hypothetical protein [Syntrophobacteraceae bacterium]
MSQYEIEYGELFALIGWDRPLQYYFVVVWRGDPDDYPVYSNLDDTKNDGSLDYQLGVLERYGIGLPPEVKMRLENDRISNTGNFKMRVKGVQPWT